MRRPTPSAAPRPHPGSLSITSPTSRSRPDSQGLYRAYRGEAGRQGLSMESGTKRVRYLCALIPTRQSHLIAIAEFVNAQYRFIMKPSGDYTVHFADPDMYVHRTDCVESSLMVSSPQLLPMDRYIASHRPTNFCSGYRSGTYWIPR